MPNRKTSRTIARDLFGNEVKAPLPLRKIVERPDGRGFAIAARERAETTYRHLGIYATRGEAAQALRDGVGLPPREKPEVLTLSVQISLSRPRR